MPDLPARKRPPQSEISNYLVEASFSGPIPPPSILKAFEEAYPGAAHRILTMAEDEGKHRRELEKVMAQAAVEEMRRDYSEARWGQVCALATSALVTICGTVAVLNGHEWGNLVTISGLGTLVGLFINGRKKAKETETPRAPRRIGKQRSTAKTH